MGEDGHKHNDIDQLQLENSESFSVEEGGSSVPGDEDDDHMADLITPTIIIIVFNIVLPTMDLRRDITVLLYLRNFPEYWGWTMFLLIGIILNFIFTCSAWWRLDTQKEKKWSWIFLVLQIWPQTKALQVISLILRKDPRARQLRGKMSREVGGLEPFLEAMPTVFLMYFTYYYRFSDTELWENAGGSWQFFWTLSVACLAMAMFLKDGPCSMIPPRGFFEGLL